MKNSELQKNISYLNTFRPYKLYYKNTYEEAWLM